jgi:hypothetical protein
VDRSPRTPAERAAAYDLVWKPAASLPYEQLLLALDTACTHYSDSFEWPPYADMPEATRRHYRALHARIEALGAEYARRRQVPTEADLAESLATEAGLIREVAGLAEKGLCRDDAEWYEQRLTELEHHIAWLRYRLAQPAPRYRGSVVPW